MSTPVRAGLLLAATLCSAAVSATPVQLTFTDVGTTLLGSPLGNHFGTHTDDFTPLTSKSLAADLVVPLFDTTLGLLDAVHVRVSTVGTITQHAVRGYSLDEYAGHIASGAVNIATLSLDGPSVVTGAGQDFAVSGTQLDAQLSGPAALAPFVGPGTFSHDPQFLLEVPLNFRCNLPSHCSPSSFPLQIGYTQFAELDVSLTTTLSVTYSYIALGAGTVTVAEPAVPALLAAGLIGVVGARRARGRAIVTPV